MNEDQLAIDSGINLASLQGTQRIRNLLLMYKCIYIYINILIYIYMSLGLGPYGSPVSAPWGGPAHLY